MSWRLSDPVNSPTGLLCKTTGFSDYVFIGDYQISMPDFVGLMRYVMENSNLLGSKDPRLAFLDACQAATFTLGHGNVGRRIVLDRVVVDMVVLDEVIPVGELSPPCTLRDCFAQDNT